MSKIPLQGNGMAAIPKSYLSLLIKMVVKGNISSITLKSENKGPKTTTNSVRNLENFENSYCVLFWTNIYKIL